ncbi:hypothetical protein JZN62_004871 [Vibrio harveyi]|nr:hypothetical protein [Vibrio harveyi]
MTSDELAYWTMIGTWFAGLATFSAVVLSLYLSASASKCKIKSVLKQEDCRSIKLTVLNRGHMYVEIDRIDLVVKKLFKQCINHDSQDLGDLSGYYFESKQEENEQYILPISSPPKSIEIDNSMLYLQYHSFVPYKNGTLDKPFKLPKCHIGIFLKSGEVFYVKMPVNFYRNYRDFVGSQFDEELYRLSVHPERYYAYCDYEELRTKQERILERYSQARKNYHLLFC